MATYKVPQDVEAEDKLIGFLSLKQFIFVLVMCASLYMCWVLAKANIILGVIPLPIVLVSGMLGLYQRKDQPVEVYLASWLRFKVKPRTRRWDQEGLEQRVIITVPKVIDKNYTKGLTEQQVSSRLNQLSAMLDSRGWASKQMPASTQTLDNQRLFSMQELSRYAHPNIPLDADRTSVADPYDTDDPRNRTSQEVERDFTASTEQQHQNALAVVEKARREARETAPRAPTETKYIETKKPATFMAKPVAKTPQPKTEVAPKPLPQKVTEKPAEPTNEEDGEVVIQLHHKK